MVGGVDGSLPKPFLKAAEAEDVATGRETKRTMYEPVQECEVYGPQKRAKTGRLYKEIVHNKDERRTNMVLRACRYKSDIANWTRRSPLSMVYQ